MTSTNGSLLFVAVLLVVLCGSISESRYAPDLYSSRFEVFDDNNNSDDIQNYNDQQVNIAIMFIKIRKIIKTNI